jgi:hypothetical protein
MIESQQEDEYKYKSYEQLSQEFQELYPAAARAFELIPQMYNRLTLIDGLTHKTAFTKIHNDHAHLHGFTARNIRRYLPANNPNIPRRVRTPRPKNSITQRSDKIFFSDTKFNDDRNRQSINNLVDDISSDKPSETASGVTSKRQEDLTEYLDCQKETTTLSTSNIPNKAHPGADNIQNYEASLPCRDIQRHITALRKNGKSEVWFAITINASKGEMISFKTGRNSELETNSIHGIDESIN